MCSPDNRPAGPFSCEALASWSHICHQEVLYALRQRQSWYYAFEQHAAGRAPDGHAYELMAQEQSPPLKAYATKAAASHMLARTSVATPLLSLAHAMLSVDNSRQTREVFAHLYGDAFVDGRLLQVSEGPTPEDPFHFIGVKHLVVKAGIHKPREYVFFDCSGSVVDDNGELVVFRVARSMPAEAACGAPLTPKAAYGSSSQPVRGELSVTYLMRATHANTRTEVTVQGLHYLNEKKSTWGTSKLVSPMWEGLKNLATLSAARALQRKLLSPNLVIKKSSSPRAVPHRAPACRVCMRGKRLLPSTRVCVGCDREVCKACTLKMHFLGGDSAETIPLRFCLNCVADARLTAGRYSDAAVAGSSSRGSGGIHELSARLRHTSSMASLSPVMGM